VDSFGKNLNQFATFDKLIASQEATLADLKQQITKATSDLGLRNKKKQEIESHINYKEKIAKEKFDNFITSALEKLSDANAVMVKSVNDVGDSAKNNIAEINTTAVGKLNSTVTNLNESINKGLMVSEKISKLESFAPIWELVEESKYEVYRTNPMLIIILEKLKEKHEDKLIFRNAIARLIASLREDIS